MDQRIGRPDSAANTHEPVYPVSMFFSGVVHSSSTPMSPNAPTDIPKDVTLPTPTSSASYLPRPPHIAIPTSSPSISGAADNRLDTGAIVGIVLGALAFVIATGAIIFYLWCRKRSSGGTRKREPRDSWIDLESKNKSDLDSLPSYDEVKAPELGVSALYTKYVPRTLGRLSPISQTVPPTFGLIKEHHLSSDLSTDPKPPPTCNGTRQDVSPGYLNDIELTVTPFDTRFDS